MKRFITLKVCIIILFSMIIFSVGNITNASEQDIIRLDEDYKSIGAFSEGMARVNLGDKYGYIDTNGKEVIPPKYKSVGNFSEGLAPVMEGGPNQDDYFMGFTGGKWGYIDKTGDVVIPIKYDHAKSFSGGIAIVCLDDGTGNYALIDKMGKEICRLQYDRVESFSEGMARVSYGEGFNYRYGYIDKTGKEVIPVMYDGAEDFSDGLALVGKLNGQYYEEYYIDKTGEVVIQAEQYYRPDNFSEGLAYVTYASSIEKKAYIDKTGKEVFLSKYDDANEFNEGLACVRLGGKYGFIDKTGKEVIPPTYDFAWKFSDGLACVELNGMFGFIDKTGKEIIPIKCDDKYVFYSEGIASVKVDGKWCLIKNPFNTKITQESNSSLFKHVKFDDVNPKSKIAFNAINNLAELGIINSIGDHKFGPDLILNREQAAIIFVALYEKTSGEEIQVPDNYQLEFKDKDQISSWALNYVKQASFAKIMNEYGDGNFGPKDNLTRIQIAVMVNNLNELVREHNTLEATGDWKTFHKEVYDKNYKTYSPYRIDDKPATRKAAAVIINEFVEELNDDKEKIASENITREDQSRLDKYEYLVSDNESYYSNEEGRNNDNFKDKMIHYINHAIEWDKKFNNIDYREIDDDYENSLLSMTFPNSETYHNGSYIAQKDYIKKHLEDIKENQVVREQRLITNEYNVYSSRATVHVRGIAEFKVTSASDSYLTKNNIILGKTYRQDVEYKVIYSTRGLFEDYDPDPFKLRYLIDGIVRKLNDPVIVND